MRDAVAGLALAALGVAYLVEAYDMPVGTWEEPGAAAFPLLLGWSLLLGATLLAARGLHLALRRRRRTGTATGNGPPVTLAQLGGPGLIVTVSVAGVLLMSQVGYMAGALLLFGATMIVLGARRPLLVGTVAALATLATDLLFRGWLGVPLP